MMKTLGGKTIFFTFRSRFSLTGTRRRYSSSSSNKTPNNNAITTPTGKSDGSSSSLTSYDEKYKALSDLDFMTAAKILFTKQPDEKKFGLDFHLVQLFFVCLPSLAVYLVAQYARSEMKKMDAELEVKKQAEFEAMSKEMELKEKAVVESNPEFLEMKERLDKIEDTIKLIIDESKRTPSDGQSDGNKLQAAQGKPDNVLGRQEASKTSVASTEVTATHASADDLNVAKNGVSTKVTGTQASADDLNGTKTGVPS